MHLHLNIDVFSLLVLIQRTVVPHEKAKSWVELSDIICPPDPGLLLAMRGKAVATVRVACSYNKHILRDGLEWQKGASHVNAQHVQYNVRHSGMLGYLHFHQTFCQQ